MVWSWTVSALQVHCCKADVTQSTSYSFWWLSLSVATPPYIQTLTMWTWSILSGRVHANPLGAAVSCSCVRFAIMTSLEKHTSERRTVIMIQILWHTFTHLLQQQTLRCLVCMQPNKWIVGPFVGELVVSETHVTVKHEESYSIRASLRCQYSAVWAAYCLPQSQINNSINFIILDTYVQGLQRLRTCQHHVPVCSWLKATSSNWNHS